ncbi:MAG: alpha-amlyase [Cytophagaceae bacterium]|nr:alpha-amlyase [Cytophagaceae bacterium]
MKKFFLPVLFLFGIQITMAQIKKIEPPFWWSDMHHGTLQIMFYGDNIADYRVSSNDFVITGITKTENPNYLFVTIETQDVAPGTYTFDFVNGDLAYAKEYEFQSRRQDAALRQGFDSSDMVYLLMPDRFANGDPDIDSTDDTTEKADRSKQGGRHGGDIQGVIDHLDYIEELGATALWSTPLCEDNDAGFSYHGYAQSDVYKIDSRYGTNEDYKNLAAELHKRDMKLIMDYVTNHWGAQHWMIKDLPTYDWIHQFPGYANSNYRMTTQYDPHASKIDTRYNEDGWFVPSMPDLNQRNPLVTTYLIQNAIWWIEFADLDGLRVDTYSYNDKENIAKWTKAIMDEYPNFNIVGEVWLHDSAQISFWQKDSKIGAIENFNSHLPTVMDFTLQDALMAQHNEEASWDGGMMRTYNNFVNDFLYPDINNLLIFAENHDTNRINQQINGSLENYKLIMTLLATTRGIPQLYYGSEIGMRGDKGKGDGDIRRDFPGGWEDDKNNAFTAGGRTAEQEAYHAFTKKVFNFRKSTPVIHTGKLLHYLPDNDVYVFFRYSEKERIMVVINNNKEAQTFDMARFSEGIADKTSGIDIISDQEINLSEKFTIQGKTSAIIELK